MEKQDYPKLRGSLEGITYPSMAEVKIDGEFNYVKKDITLFLVNKSGKRRENLDVLDEIDKKLKKFGIKTITMVAELYAGEGKKGDLYKLLKKDSKPKLFLFDLIEMNGERLEKKPLIERREMLFNLIPEGFLNNQFCIVNSHKETKEFFKKTVGEGYEGIVVKRLNGVYVNGPCDWAKMKFKDKNNYVVVSVDKNSGRIEVNVPQMKNGRMVNTKVGCVTKENVKTGDLVTIEHQGILNNGGLRHPVFIKIEQKGFINDI